VDGRWAQEAEALLTGVKEWRLAHPRATLTEIEAAVDERLARVRARLIADAALASAAADLAACPAEARPDCPRCGQALALRGPEVRHLTTTHGQDLARRRHYLTCPACGEALFPPG
jgi:predicted RNA-binding Zn-ribbon protein involved in translation (DUF1610 family)